MVHRALISRALALAAFGISLTVFADNITLKNGDQLTGTITQVDPAVIKFTSPLLGPMSIPRGAVKSVHSDNPVSIVNDAGQSHSAYVGPSAEGTAIVEAPAVIPVPPPAPPPAAAPAPAHAPLDLEPYFLPVGPHWKNQLAIGVVNTTGNTESTEFTGEADFNYKVLPSEFNLKIGGGYGQTNGTSDAQFAFLDAIYRRDLPELHTDRWFLFAETHELYDALKGISFRSINSVGPGYYLVKSKKLNVDLRAGPGVTYVKHFDDTESTDFTGMAGLRAVYDINDHLSASEDLLYTIGLTDTSRYQIISETALKLKLPELARGMGLKFAFVDDYDSTATEGREYNDTRLTLSLTLDFESGASLRMARRNILLMTLPLLVLGLVAANLAEDGAADNEQLVVGLLPWIVGAAIAFVVLGVMLFFIHNFGGTLYARHRVLTFAENTYLFFLNLLLNIALSGSSSSSGGSGGGVSSGGGSFGGGGASGSW